MAENNAPVSFVDLAIVMKYLDPNMSLSEAQLWVSNLKNCMSDAHLPLLAFFNEDALRIGLSVPGSAQEKIQAADDYMKTHPDCKPSSYVDSFCTSPQRIVNELLEALKGNLNFWKDAKSMEDRDISTLSSDVLLLAAQTFMVRNKHYHVSDEEALQVFHKAIQYLNGDKRTSTEFIKCESSELSEIIQCVNRHFTLESIDMMGLRITKRVMESINQDREPPKPDGYIFSWDLHLLSEVDCLKFTYAERNIIFSNKSDDYIFPEWERMGQNCYRWYIFRAGAYQFKEYYALQLKKTVTINGFIIEFKGDFSVSDNPVILKRFQDAKINGDCTDDFQGTCEYSWSKDGKPPASPYAIVAQLYWVQLYRELNYLQVQSKPHVTDKEALKILYEEIPSLKGKNDSTFKKYTWFLNKPSDAVLNIPELREYSAGQTFSDDYLRPSTEALQTEGFSYEWSREDHESTHQDFSLIYRARPTCERVPQLITEETRIRFDYWQYIKEFIFFGGSHREGDVLAPDPAWIDEAHRNGVAIFGTVFLAPLAYGGQVSDLEELAKPESLEKLIDIAQQLNFEGWFLNVESFEDYSEPAIGELKSSVEKLDLKGKKLIWYLPSREQSDRFDPKSEGVTMTCDDKINNTAPAFLEEKGKKLYLNFHVLHQILYSEHEKCLQKYLMFVDEPFWQNAQDDNKSKRKYRFAYACNCHWQFFLGENGLERKPTDPFPWYGIAKYAKERKKSQVGISDI